MRHHLVHPRALLAAVVAGTLAFVLVPPPAGARSTAGATKKSKARVVVAVVDTGINPYHEFFNAGGTLYKKAAPNSVTPQVLKEFGIDRAHVIRLTRTGNFKSDFKKDSAQFDKMKKGEPYWFEGTNVIGISFQDGGRLRPDGTASSHGIGTAGAVLAANPDAIVVAVEGINAESEEWAFTHPAVDIVSTSYGPVTSIPTLTHLSFSYTGVVENGKVHFGASANDPTLSPLDQTSGPWWTIGIAGFQEGTTEGRQLLSGNLPDFVGDFTQDLPYCRSCEKDTQTVSGTSFATPRSAGTFSKVLLEARRAAGHRGGIVTKGVDLPLLVKGKLSFTIWDARRALEEAAYYPGVGDYQPGADGTFDLTSVPIVDAAPWLQTGWGAITPDPEHDVVAEALARLGVRGKSDRSKSPEACEAMKANIAARHAYWDNAAVFGESFGTSNDPYVYC